MDKLTKSFTSKQVPPKWLLIDLQNQVLGRAASQIAQILRGKHKPQYTPHDDVGDFVIVVNASQIKITGKKSEQKKYYHHSGYVGGLKEKTFAEVLQKNPDRIIIDAVKGMLPKTDLGRKILKKLKVYAGTDHPHQAQKIESFVLNQ